MVCCRPDFLFPSPLSHAYGATLVPKKEEEEEEGALKKFDQRGAIVKWMGERNTARFYYEGDEDGCFNATQEGR